MSFNEVSDKDIFSYNLFNHSLKIWFYPEIERRIEAGTLNPNDPIKAAQVIIYPDKRPNEIRLNQEVKANAQLLIKKGVSKERGDPVFLHEIVENEAAQIELTENEDPNCGHITIYRIGDSYHIAFDFRYNKEIASKYLVSSKQFFESAQECLKEGRINPFIDNLYSAAELAIKSHLLTWWNIKKNQNMGHKDLKHVFNDYANLGNIKKEQQNTYNELYSLRPRVRYNQPDYSITDEKAKELLRDIKNLIEDTEKRILPRTMT